MFAAIARSSVQFRWAIVAITALLIVPAAIYGSGVFSALKPGGYEAPDAEAYVARGLIDERLGVSRADVIALYTVESGNIVESPAAAEINEAIRVVSEDAGVRQGLSFFNTGSPTFVSQDGRRTFAVFTLAGDEQARVDTFERIEHALEVSGALTEIGGEIAAFRAFDETFERDLQRAEFISFPIMAILLLLIFRTAVAAGLALVLGALAIVFALALLRALSVVTDISVFAVNVVTILGLGMAVDYSLFILSRYREELQEKTPEEALIATVSTTGRAVAFSGVTLGTSLIGLFVFPQLFLRSMAIGGIAVAALAIVIAITVLPALIAVLGPRVESLAVPFLKPRPAEVDRPGAGFWHNLALQVMRRPALIGGAVVVFLLVLGIPFLDLQTSRQDVRALDTSFEVRRVDDVMNAEFLPHETTPHLIAFQATGDVLVPERIGALFDYHQALAQTPGITRVDSIFSLAPGLTREEYQAMLSTPPGGLPPEIAGALPLFVDGDVTRMAAVSQFDIDVPEGQRQVTDIRSIPLASGIETLVGGNAAELHDTKRVILQRIPFTLLIVATATFVALFLVFGSVTLPIKAMLMNAMSLTAAFGTIVFVFQHGRFESLLGYESLGTIDVTLPVLMFAFLFGLSMDYEVLMLSRVREEYVRTGDNSLAVARGLEKTGRLITSAAALLIVVLAAFATSDLALMKALGIGMAVAIAIDATIVRALLVPASMRLMGAWNWWAPQPLVRLWERAGLGDLEGHAEPEKKLVHPSLVVPAYRPAPAPAAAHVAAPPAAEAATAPATVAVATMADATAETVVLPRSAAVRAFLVHEGPPPQEEHVVEFGVNEVGRLSSARIQVADPMVSGRHAALERRMDGTFVVRDLGSTNGTFVNGERIDAPATIGEDDEIGLGDQRFRLRLEREPEPPPPEPLPPGPASVTEAPERLVDPTVAIRTAPEGIDLLVQVAGAGAGTSYPLTGDTITLGRDPRNEVVVADPKVSAFHAHIQRGLDGGLVVEDRGSTNGTTVNQAPLDGAHRLADDDVIEVGDTAFQFKRFALRGGDPS